ncbi:Hypothetical protein GLP15_2085 [Giardia lamblia P15]|uniref:Uncharacterized protein n=1 Tax=Giardia intestinalis (strain P15) TaxID=658858 RepID=E1F035_GIAIA|nr:Hypothetical protein GLP15_2085 [Giardia lamblia P15]
MPSKPEQTTANRLQSQSQRTAAQRGGYNESRANPSYLDKLPNDMLTNLYNPPKREQQRPPADIHALIFSRLREIDRQYYKETSAEVIKDLQELVNQNLHTLVIDSANSNSDHQHDKIAKKSDGKVRRPISVKPQKAPFAITHPSGETRVKSKSAQAKLSQLLGDDYVSPEASISLIEVSDYLTGKAELMQQNVGRCIAEYTRKEQANAFEAKLAKMTPPLASSKSKQIQSISLVGSSDYNDMEAHIYSRTIIGDDTECTMLSLADFHDQISRNGYSKSSACRSSAGETLDEPAEKVRVILHGNLLGPVEREKRFLESKRRLLLQALKRTNSYTEKEAITKKLQHMMN